jgi:hypothetical protein
MYHLICLFICMHLFLLLTALDMFTLKRVPIGCCPVSLSLRLVPPSREAVFAGLDACVTPVLDRAEAAAHAHSQSRRSFLSGLRPAPAPRFTDPASAGGGAGGAGGGGGGADGGGSTGDSSREGLATKCWQTRTDLQSGNPVQSVGLPGTGPTCVSGKSGSRVPGKPVKKLKNKSLNLSLFEWVGGWVGWWFSCSVTQTKHFVFGVPSFGRTYI